MIHAHRWRIASPDGRRMLPAECACGAAKTFPAVIEVGYGEPTPLTLKGSVKHARPAKPPKSPATHCVKGHELTAANLVVESTGRTRCKTCRRVYSAKPRHKQKNLTLTPTADQRSPEAERDARAVIQRYEGRG